MSNPNLMECFFTEKLKFYMPLISSELKRGKELYDFQVEHLANAILIDDYNANIAVDKCSAFFKTPFIFPEGTLLSGSFIMSHVASHFTNGSSSLKYDDIDLYFKSKADAQLFLSMNNLDPAHGFYGGFKFSGPMCAYGIIGKLKVNLIYGVEYKDAGDLISRFDIRACSMALDLNANTLYFVRGSIEDATQCHLTFNPVPRGVSVRRFTKYIHKGFEADKYQNLFFVELLRSDIYSPELELMTKEY